MDDEKKDKGVKPNLDSNDPRSPYYLCSSVNPGNTICPIILNGKNYETWSRLTANSLRLKNKLGFVDGTLTKPVDASSDVDA